MIKRLIKTGNDTPINSMATFKDPESGVDVSVSGVTLGAVADALRQDNWYIKTNSRSGSIPSNTMQQAKLMRVLSSLSPQSSAWNRLMVQYAQLNDADISEGEISPPEAMPTLEEQNEQALEMPLS
jgi:hypothetical protein